MSLSQVSFAAFAQSIVCPPPPASQEVNGSVLSLAAPAEPGVGVDTPLPYGGVFEPSRRLAMRELHDGVFGAYWDDWQIYGCALDAPESLPSGSHQCFDLFDYVKACGFGVSRRYL
ncbi:hypothetical protein EJP69_00385 [Variovorax gossypii]|uniref:Uncharacterized protein n=1 Tax=Variovorax gossypii TaxID=1679495 RepID=A0A431TPZ5_9BURK|nr:hypothetical protein [Variovorax gossypii]RTQ36251.1 hypothetical protein EJP69_00385 [Variovorax gossypii]